MKIGLIVHGPEVVDSGECSRILNILHDHLITAKLGGIMGKNAILDAKLENIIDITEQKKPSEQLDELFSKNLDLIILLNHGKNLETGIYFGGAVISNSKKFINAIPLIQIERPKEKDGIMFAWNESGKRYLKKLQKILKIPISDRIHEIPQRFRIEAGKNYRTLLGVNPNEKIFLNNVIIGYSKSKNVTIVEKNGEIIEIEGGEINTHGLEKIKSKIDLKSAMIKTAINLRKNPAKSQRIVDKIVSTKQIAILFNAENVYEVLLKNVDMIISIGDDTTAIIAYSASRFNVPIIGIIDGDMDGLLNSIHKKITLKDLGNVLPLAKNSIILQVDPGWDDKVGALIKSLIFKDKDIIGLEEINLKDMRQFKQKILETISEYIVLKFEKS
ncbi:MAG: DUF2117 domain-containing protein [Candidatus Helarchaeota archaeon]